MHMSSNNLEPKTSPSHGGNQSELVKENATNKPANDDAGERNVTQTALAKEKGGAAPWGGQVEKRHVSFSGIQKEQGAEWEEKYPAKGESGLGQQVGDLTNGLINFKFAPYLHKQYRLARGRANAEAALRALAAYSTTTLGSSQQHLPSRAWDTVRSMPEGTRTQHATAALTSMLGPQPIDEVRSYLRYLKKLHPPAGDDDPARAALNDLPDTCTWNEAVTAMTKSIKLQDGKPVTRQCSVCDKDIELPRSAVGAGRVYVCRTCAAKQADKPPAEKVATPTAAERKNKVKAMAASDRRRAAAKGALLNRLKSLEGKPAAAALERLPATTRAMDVPFHSRSPERKEADISVSKEAAPPAGEEIETAAEPDKTAWCEDLIKTGRCIKGSVCEFKHLSPGTKPHVQMTLDPEPVTSPGDHFRERRDPYLGANPENHHLRVLEPLPEAWADYDVPECRVLGIKALSSMPTEARNRHLRTPLGAFIDYDTTKKVRLLTSVVEAMREHFLFSPASMEVGEFYVGCHRCVRLTVNLRITAAEVKRHKHYATLLGWYDQRHNEDVARVHGEAWNLSRALKVLALAKRWPVTTGLAAGVVTLAATTGLRLAQQSARISQLAEVNYALASALAPKLRAVTFAGDVARAASFAGDVWTNAADLASAWTEEQVWQEARKSHHFGGDLRASVHSLVDRTANAVASPRSTIHSLIDRTLNNGPGMTLEAALNRAVHGPRALLSDSSFVNTFFKSFYGTCLEEVLKHPEQLAASTGTKVFVTGLSVTNTIVVIEALSTVLAFMGATVEEFWAALGCRLLTTGMHYATWALPIQQAVPTHYLWNQLVAPGMSRFVNSFRPLAASEAIRHALTGALAPVLLKLVQWVLRLVETRIRVVRLGNALRALQLAAQIKLACERTALVVTDKHLHRRRDREPKPITAYLGDSMVPTKVTQIKAGVTIIQKPHDDLEDSLAQVERWVYLKDDRRSLLIGDMTQTGGVLEHSIQRALICWKYGFGMPEYRPVYPAFSQENHQAVARHRIAKATQLGDLHSMLDFVEFCYRFDHKLFRWPNGTIMGRVHPVTWEAALKSLGSSPQVKVLLQKTHDWLESKGITIHSHLSPGVLRWVGRSFKVFLKREGLSLRWKGEKINKAARPICPMHPIFLCLTVQYLLAIQGAVFKCWGVNFFLVMSGKEVSCADVGRILGEAFEASWELVEDDCGTWDMSKDEQVVPLNKHDVLWYKRHGAPRATCQLMLMATSCNLRMPFGIKIVKPDGQTNSGSVDTYLGNGLRNAKAHLYVYMRTVYNLPGATVRRGMLHDGAFGPSPPDMLKVAKTQKMVVAGDDDAAAHKPLPGGLGVPFQLGMAALGHEAETRYCTTPDTLGFCSKVNLISSEGWRYSTLAGRALSRHGYICDPPRDVEPESLMRGVALSSLDNDYHNPLLRALWLRILDLTNGHEPWFDRKRVHKMAAGKRAEPTAQTWEQLEYRYGWNQEVQRRWVAHLATLKLGDDIDFPEAAWACSVDTDGPVPYATHPAKQPLNKEFAALGPLLYPEVEMLEEDDLPKITAQSPAFESLLTGIERGCGDGYAEYLARTCNKRAHVTEGNTAALASAAAVATAITIALKLGPGSAAGPAPTIVQVHLDWGTLTETIDLPLEDGMVEADDVLAYCCIKTGLTVNDLIAMCEGVQLTPGGRAPPTNGRLEVKVLFKLRGGATGKKTKKLAKQVANMVIGRSKKKSTKAKTRKKKKAEVGAKNEHRLVTGQVMLASSTSSAAVSKRKGKGTGKKLKVPRPMKDRVTVAGGVARLWLRAMENPFQHEPPRFGAGKISTRMVRKDQTLTLPIAVFTSANNPTGVAWTYVTPGCNNAPIWITDQAPIAAVSMATVFNNANWAARSYNWAQQNSIGSSFDNGRLMACGIGWSIGMKSSVMMPAVYTATPPMPDNLTTTLGTWGPSALQQPAIGEMVVGEKWLNGWITSSPWSMDPQFRAAPVSITGSYTGEWTWPILCISPGTSVSTGDYSITIRYVEWIEGEVGLQQINTSSVWNTNIVADDPGADYDYNEMFDMAMKMRGSSKVGMIQAGITQFGHLAGAGLDMSFGAVPKPRLATEVWNDPDYPGCSEAELQRRAQVEAKEALRLVTGLIKKGGDAGAAASADKLLSSLRMVSDISTALRPNVTQTPLGDDSVGPSVQPAATQIVLDSLTRGPGEPVFRWSGRGSAAIAVRDVSASRGWLLTEDVALAGDGYRFCLRLTNVATMEQQTLVRAKGPDKLACKDLAYSVVVTYWASQKRPVSELQLWPDETREWVAPAPLAATLPGVLAKGPRQPAPKGFIDEDAEDFSSLDRAHLPSSPNGEPERPNSATVVRRSASAK